MGDFHVDRDYQRLRTGGKGGSALVHLVMDGTKDYPTGAPTWEWPPLSLTTHHSTV